MARIKLFAPANKTGRSAFAVTSVLRIHFMRQWFVLIAPAMEKALQDAPLYRNFAKLDAGIGRLPDESNILRLRHRRKNDLSQQIMVTINAMPTKKGLMFRTYTVVEANIIVAPSSAKNSTSERAHEMHQTQKSNHWHYGMKAHVSVGSDSVLMHTVIGIAANGKQVTQGRGLLHDQEAAVFVVVDYQGAMKRYEAIGFYWQMLIRPGKRQALNKQSSWAQLRDKAEKIMTSI